VLLKPWKARAGMLALTAIMVGVPVVGLADPVGAAPNPNRCQSVNGVVVYSYGTATCVSAASTGSQPDVATATGDHSIALAVFGSNNTVTVTGSNSSAEAAYGDNNTVTATGSNSSAEASFGDNNTVTATGPNSSAYAIFGDNNMVTTNGKGSVAYTEFGSNNTVTANGSCTLAEAFVSNVTDSCHP
jgi:hypothetical protein